MFLKKLFYRFINFFNKDKLKLKNIGSKMYILHPDGAYEVCLKKGTLYKLTVAPEIKIEKID